MRNEGDSSHASMERMWDIVLTWRMAVLGLPPMFGLAVDDMVQRFVGAMCDLMRGNLDWSYESGRYRPTVASSPKGVPEPLAAGSALTSKNVSGSAPNSLTRRTKRSTLPCIKAA